MRVVKVLNNSLVLAISAKGEETILMGKGIGFHKAAGYEFQASEVEKVFVLKDREISRNIIRLAADTDSVFFEISKEVIDVAKNDYQMELMDHIYLALTDHLAFAVRRQKEGVEIPNFYTTAMKNFNEAEFTLGKLALKIVEEKTGISLAPDEAGNIAFHFINAQVNHPFNEKNRQISQLTKDVLDIVKYKYRITYNEETLSYTRYLTHVRLFAQRLISKTQLPEEQSLILYDSVAAVCKSEFKCVERIDQFVYERFGVHLTNQESLYLAVHIYRVLEDLGVRGADEET